MGHRRKMEKVADRKQAVWSGMGPWSPEVVAHHLVPGAFSSPWLPHWCWSWLSLCNSCSQALVTWLLGAGGEKLGVGHAAVGTIHLGNRAWSVIMPVGVIIPSGQLDNLVEHCKEPRVWSSTSERLASCVACAVLFSFFPPQGSLRKLWVHAIPRRHGQTSFIVSFSVSGTLF
jgi:hypothetical protein